MPQSSQMPQPDPELARLIAAELRSAADEIVSAVPPLEAGPRTEFERGLVAAAIALRARASRLTEGGTR